MQMPLAILCYHRVLPDDERHGAGRPYFDRGTAVSERNFEAQMRSVAKHFEVLGETDVLAWINGERDFHRPACWITFDDGYRDVLGRAAPVLARRKLPATVFVTTGVVDGGRWLPADRWYATVNRATRHRGMLQAPGESTWQFDLSCSSDYSRLVDGPERRRYLMAPPRQQETLLGHLADALHSQGLPPPDLYLSRASLRLLYDSGWSIGGHGQTHAILSDTGGADHINEIRGPRQFLEALGLGPRSFAYPDGAFDSASMEMVQRMGWATAVTLGNRAAHREDGRFRLPRFLACDDPTWIEGTLLNTLASAPLQ